MKKLKEILLPLLLGIAVVILTSQIIRLQYQLKDVDLHIDKASVVLENIHARKSVRKFTEQQVPDSLITILLKAGMAAPSGHDTRPWQFIVTKDKEKIKQLRAGLEWARGLDYSPAAIIVCGDMRKVKDINQEFWITDSSAATQNILLATEALGLGAVWSTLYPGEERMQHAREVLGLPAYIMPLAILPLGYPLEDPKPKVKFDEKLIHWEDYTEYEVE